MRTTELLDFLQKHFDTDCPIGHVCAVDQIPLNIPSKPRFYIVNTDVSDRPGHHWVLFYFPQKGRVEYFDPAGYPPEAYHNRFRDVLILNGPRYVHNLTRVQDPGSILCGEYCLYVALKRCKGLSYIQALHTFGSYNDSKVLAFLS